MSFITIIILAAVVVIAFRLLMGKAIKTGAQRGQFVPWASWCESWDSLRGVATC